ncbi:MAG: Ldh family oxidoreductase, partial [Chloroflexi bacterium]|nr:Ldh family oxidoreductase [Chloroflexota bacterium]
ALVETNHIGRLGEYAERAAARGVIGFITLGLTRPDAATLVMAPYGGAKPAFSTNPVCFGIPAGDDRTVLMDYATATIAANKVRVARDKGVPLPPDSLLDRDGRPTTNPDDFVDDAGNFTRGGMLQAFGKHKGYGLAVVAELLGNVLAPDLQVYPGPSGRNGVFMLAINTTAFQSKGAYEAAAKRTVERIKAVPPAPDFDEVLLPGEPELRSRDQRNREGIPVPDATWETLRRLAREAGVPESGLA